MEIEDAYIQELIQDFEILQDPDGVELILDEYVNENCIINHPIFGKLYLVVSARVKVFGNFIWEDNEFWETGRETSVDEFKVVDEHGVEVNLSHFQYKLIENKIEAKLGYVMA